MIISMILSTDMAVHFELLAKFNDVVEVRGSSWEWLTSRARLLI